MADEDRGAQEGETRWVPSIAVVSGALLQRQSGRTASFLFDGEALDPTLPIVLRQPNYGWDRPLTAMVGGVIELMTPALPIPTRPRFFVSGELIPLFASERNLAIDGDPDRIRGPDEGAILAVDENSRFYTDPPDGPRVRAFADDAARGQGARTTALVGNLAWGARVGVSFPGEIFGRQIRLKPSVGWMRYTVELEGEMVDPTCRPVVRCTNVYNPNGTLNQPGLLRESIMRGTAKRTFDGYGPGFDVEMDTGRFGPLGIAIFGGFHSYYIFGEREISVTSVVSYEDFDGLDTHSATWRIRVAPWAFRGILGVRLQWLGGAR